MGAPASRGLSGWHIASRVVAALIPGFVLANTAAIFAGFLFPGEKFIGVAWATVLSFGFYAAIVIWVFSVKRLRTVWIGLLSAIAVTSLGAWGLFVLESAG